MFVCKLTASRANETRAHSPSGSQDSLWDSKALLSYAEINNFFSLILSLLCLYLVLQLTHLRMDKYIQETHKKAQRIRGLCCLLGSVP